MVVAGSTTGRHTYYILLLLFSDLFEYACIDGCFFIIGYGMFIYLLTYLHIWCIYVHNIDTGST